MGDGAATVVCRHAEDVVRLVHRQRDRVLAEDVTDDPAAIAAQIRTVVRERVRSPAIQGDSR